MLRHAWYGAAVPDELVQYRDPAARCVVPFHPR